MPEQESDHDFEILKAENSALKEMVDVLEKATFDQSRKLEDALIESQKKGETLSKLNRELREQAVERLRAEEAARREAERAQEYFDIAGSILLVLESDGSVQRINRIGCELLQRGEGEIVGRNWFEEFLPEEGREESRQWFLKALTVRVSENFESSVILADGQIRKLAWRNALIRDGAGTPKAILSSGIDISDRVRLEERLRHEAQHDYLTGLANRQRFLERLNWCVARARRKESYGFAVLFLDLDRFKLVNDSLGHDLGDELLKEVAARISRSVRDVDLVARFGGDEFTILADDIKDVRDATRVAERVLHSLASPFMLGGHEVFTGASIGIAPNSLAGHSAELLLRDADTALYRAKEKGRGCYVIFDEEMHALVMRSLRLESDVKIALREGQFYLVYQPICDVKTGGVRGFEALLRWDHPTAGNVSPAEFIPIAEDIGFIHEIGTWVLKESCLQMSQWQRGLPSAGDLQININVSLKQLVRSDFASAVAEAIQDSGVRPSTVNLEFTEGVFLRDPAQIQEVFAELHSMGVKLHLDDFGTGYSSLNYLKQFPIEFLKIDRSFIQHVHVNVADTEVVRAILALASAFNLEVIAEGIETEEQRAMLQKMNCRLGQGYLFARPLRLNQVEAYLRDSLLKSAG